MPTTNQILLFFGKCALGMALIAVSGLTLGFSCVVGAYSANRTIERAELKTVEKGKKIEERRQQDETRHSTTYAPIEAKQTATTTTFRNRATAALTERKPTINDATALQAPPEGYTLGTASSISDDELREHFNAQARAWNNRVGK